MGVDYYAHAVIGCEVTGKLTKRVTAPGCPHVSLPATAPFCAFCGKPSTKVVEAPIDGYDEEDHAIGNYCVVGTTDGERQFVGLIASSDPDVNGGATRLGGDLPDLNTFKLELRLTLEPLGIWDDKSFGLWSLIRCSY